jgi:hypothetical protein
MNDYWASAKLMPNNHNEQAADHDLQPVFYETVEKSSIVS